MTSRAVGASVLRHEDVPLLRGTARFAADLQSPGLLRMKVIRSQVAHGLLQGIARDAALALDGVVAVLTADDVLGDLGVMPFISTRLPAPRLEPFRQPVLAYERVRYVGEPFAIIIAEDPYLAEDAEELVAADIEPLPTSLDLRGACGEATLFLGGDLVDTIEVQFGDAGRLFDEAPVVVAAEFRIGRHTAVPLETRALTVEYKDGSLVVHGATKVPHWNRAELSRQLAIDPERITMRETSVGGGFGVRGEVYPEDFLAAWAALKLQRSIAWTEDRREHFMATNHSRDQIHEVALAGTADGKVLALRGRCWTDAGAYVRTNGLRVAENTVAWLPGPYDVDAYTGLVHSVVTNRTPTGTMRGPGAVESTFSRERLVDIYAARIGMDPVDVRRKTLIKRGQLPYERPSGNLSPQVFEEGDSERLFEDALARAHVASVERRRAAGEHVGFGVGVFFERSNAGGWEKGEVEITPSGEILVRSGASSVGQGIRTTLAQVVADVFGVDHHVVRVELLDTDRIAQGVGSFASRSAVMAGNAVYRAAADVVAQAKDLAAEELEVDPGDLVVGAGAVWVAGAPARRRTLAELAARHGDDEHGLHGEATFEAGLTYDFGAHVAVVRLDPELGTVALERLVVAFDVGRAINPTIVEGQLAGAAAQGVGGILLEELRHDDDGNPVTTSLMDYLLPTACEIPTLDVIIDESAPARANPLGAKGAGEAGIIGVAAAVAGAVSHAAGDAGLVRTTPIHPASIAIQ